MEIEQVLNRKKQVEQNFENALDSFRHDTGLKISAVIITKKSQGPEDEVDERHSGDVFYKVEIIVNL